MNKSLGVSAMVVALLAILVPVVTVYVVWLALILATIAGLMGDKTYPIVTIVISVVNIVFLSPMTWVVFKGEDLNGNSFFLYVTIALAIAPIVAMVISPSKSIQKNNEKMGEEK